MENSGWNVVIVDDECLVREGLKHLIHWQQEGFSIVGEASNGKEALELLSRETVHIVITDTVMPIMNGKSLIKSIKKLFPHIQMILLSEFGEFDYVHDASNCGIVDVILKHRINHNKLLDSLEKAIHLIRKERKGYVNHLFKMAVFEKNFRNIGAIASYFKDSHFFLLGLKNESVIKNEVYIQYQCDHILEALQSEQEIIPWFLLEEGRKVIFLINVNLKRLSSIKQSISHLSKINSHQRTYYVLSSTYESIQQLCLVGMNELCKLFTYTFFFPNQTFLTMKDLPSQVFKKRHFDLDLFLEQLRAQHYDQAFSSLQTHITYLSTEYNQKEYEFKRFIQTMIMTLSSFLMNKRSDIDQMKWPYIKYIDDSPHIRRVLLVWNRFVEKVKERIVLPQKHLGKTCIFRIKSYMKEHYAEPISLNDVASHFHFNSSYFSKYFKTHSKETFIEYLNKLRVEQAKKLLVSDLVLISDICRAVGFTDHSYFCKVFKKVTKQSPSEYRENSMKLKKVIETKNSTNV
ncbi:response regulator transcription factor [Alkalihalobacillus hemicellulosilyticus]|uniref:Two-component response regulator n=1 Tax=Halalkalibacter hemicellulosilyticusJCM 9152 TaxID=1236971 RepID=W4QD64_9BACI|nr:response regulator [Halalkalibacter hemicellulosilyticus]GAE29623.1 two-component response regulator [Halalkalibacter hemicellulosilyticusJCM 9152]